MRRLLPHLLALVLGSACAVGLAACGGESAPGLLSGGRADNVKEAFRDVQRAIEAGDCDDIDAELANARAQATELPGDTDPGLADNLAQAADALEQAARDECDEQERETETTTTPTTTEPVPTEPEAIEPPAETQPEPEPEPDPAPEPAPAPAPEPGPSPPPGTPPGDGGSGGATPPGTP